MSKQWVRQEIKRNDLAEKVESVAIKVQQNRQTAIVIAVGVVVIIAAVGVAYARISKTRTDAWEKLAIAQTYAYQGQLKAAQEQLQPVVEGPAKPAAYALLFAGDIYFKNGQFKEAQESYQKLVDRQAPKSLVPIAMADVALAAEAGGDCKAALEANQRYLDANQDHFMAPQALASMARCQASAGQAVQAKSTLDRIALLYPDSYWSQWAKERLSPPAAAPKAPAAKASKAPLAPAAQQPPAAPAAPEAPATKP